MIKAIAKVLGITLALTILIWAGQLITLYQIYSGEFGHWWNVLTFMLYGIAFRHCEAWGNSCADLVKLLWSKRPRAKVLR